jgi:hypothetical protein
LLRLVNAINEGNPNFTPYEVTDARTAPPGPKSEAPGKH